MTNFLDFYRAYGESLASRLRVIGHTPNQMRFVFVEDMQSAEELIAAMASSLKVETNVLVWERATEQLRTGSRDNYNTRFQGSLAVIRKPTKDNRDTHQSVIDECRNAAVKVMALMLKDEQDEDSALSQEGIRFELDGQSGEPIPVLPHKWYGYGFTFDWLAPIDLSLTEEDLVG